MSADATGAPTREAIRETVGTLTAELEHTRLLAEGRSASRLKGIAKDARLVIASCDRDLAVLRWLSESIVGLLEDRERIEWLAAWAKGEQLILPPGEHGGAADNWLIARQDANDPRHSSYGLVSDEWEAPTLREAIDAARASLPEDSTNG
jgi:hypothetical protein